jgi:hypothetical protein
MQSVSPSRAPSNFSIDVCWNHCAESKSNGSSGGGRGGRRSSDRRSVASIDDTFPGGCNPAQPCEVDWFLYGSQATDTSSKPQSSCNGKEGREKAKSLESLRRTVCRAQGFSIFVSISRYSKSIRFERACAFT